MDGSKTLTSVKGEEKRVIKNMASAAVYFYFFAFAVVRLQVAAVLVLSYSEGTPNGAAEFRRD